MEQQKEFLSISDIKALTCLKEVVEKGTVLEVTENRGAHLISEGVAEAVREAKAAAKGKE